MTSTSAASPVALIAGTPSTHENIDQSGGELCRRVTIASFLSLNFFTSILVVWNNKLIFQTFNFKYGTLLTSLHFFATWICLEICRRCGLFEYKKLELSKVLPLCYYFCGFVVLTNLSLTYNTVGFYQLTKMATTPALVCLQTIFFNQPVPLTVTLSLTLSSIGVLVGTVGDATANMAGSFFGGSAVFITALYQITIGQKQKELDCDPYQLLYWQAPVSGFLLIPIIPIFDADLGAVTSKLTAPLISAIATSCLLGFLVNLSIFLIIGKTSPITYHVLGYLKLVGILSMGTFWFEDRFNPRTATGAIMMLVGVLWYTKIKIDESKKIAKEKEAMLPNCSPNDEASKLTPSGEEKEAEQQR